MLKLANITKDYKVADTTVRALKGINLCFRQNEFVSVLGPSGCGKTTLLNIVGGLDKYTSGDLFIFGKSTKEYKDKDWDVYRNHRIGFIFQSYNLIPHQNVLANVELALTIAGMSKAERVAKAKQALDKVGLSDQCYKRPNQLSGGQCQRVAIARALVNDPEILLADEPTGALDTTTSEQIMKLIKEIAKERLVIMVTHNPELAEEYSTRIIRLLDGVLVSDTNPFNEKDEKEESRRLAAQLDALNAASGMSVPVVPAVSGDNAGGAKPKQKKEKAKMSFFTAFRLSLQNLFSKKARTIMISIAGSIGIIGISLVLSISYGVNRYIDNMQNDMLSGNPITVQETSIDINAFMSQMGTSDTQHMLKEAGYVNVSKMIESLAKRAESMENIMIQNTITKEYIDYLLAMPEEYIAAIFLDYGLNVLNNIYTDFSINGSGPGDNISLSAIRTIYTSVLEETDFAEYAELIAGLSDMFMQAPKAEDYILSQYNVLDGKLASGKNEVMIVVNRHRELSDLSLAQLGYFTQDEFVNMVYKATDGKDYNKALDREQLEYDELMGKRFTWYSNDTIFNEVTNEHLKQYTPFTYDAYYKDSFKDKAGYGERVELEVVGILEPKEDISYGCLTNGFYYTEALTKHILESNLKSAIVKYFADNNISSFTSRYYTEDFDLGGGIVVPKGTITGITFGYNFTFGEKANEKRTACVGSVNAMGAMMSSFLGMMGQGSDDLTLPKEYTLSARQLGGIDVANSISIYPVDFTQKDFVLEYLDRWNSEEDIVVNGVTLKADEREHITYSDLLSLIISMIKTFIQLITIALIGFTALALVVSTVMIAIITYVSVVERVKEIGVIRSLGGRKRDVSNLFTAETFIIGLASGLIGILVTYFVSWVINLIVRAFAGITIAVFPWFYALIMVGLSVLLTLISGLMPSAAAAKKDPVVALRTE